MTGQGTVPTTRLDLNVIFKDEQQSIRLGGLDIFDPMNLA